MQDFFKLNGKKVIQPDGYSAALATTSTEDSDRDMRLVMHNTVVGTVQAYDLSWRYISLADAAEILSHVYEKNFTAHYMDIFSGKWRDADFYASNFNAPCKTLEDGVECWDELSFSIIGVQPR